MTDSTPTTPTPEQETSAEALAHSLLRLAGDMPGQLGRLRAARVVGGYHGPVEDDVQAARLAQYAPPTPCSWPLREVVDLVDAMLQGGLLAQTAGTRPTLCLTRAGHRALDSMEVVEQLRDTTLANAEKLRNG